MTILALDVGNRRIGVAVSDPTDLVVRPLMTIVRKIHQTDGEAIQRLLNETKATSVVVGMPLNADGTLSPQAQVTREFVRFLKKILPVPVVTWDEHLTTQEAERELIAQGVSRSRRQAMIDAAAAAILLEDWLIAHRPRSIPPGETG